MLHTQYKSSTKAKATVRRQRAYCAGDESKSDTEMDTTGTGTKQQQQQQDDEENQDQQQSTLPTMKKDDTNSPRKRARTIAMAQADASMENTALTLLEVPPPDAVYMRSEQGLALSSFSSISSLVAPVGIPGYDALHSFSSLPNLSRSSIGGIGEKPFPGPAANKEGATQFNNPKTVPQQEIPEQPQLQRQRQFAATRTSGVLGCTGGEGETVPFMEPLISATQRSTSFGETIDEMYQAQLFSSDNTMESSSSGSMAKLPAPQPDN
jgi:hypothetical protein